MTPGRWLRFACGIWTAGDEPAIWAEDWDRLLTDTGQVTEGEDVYLAPSVGHNAAVAVAAPRPDGCVAVAVEHLAAQTAGRSER